MEQQTVNLKKEIVKAERQVLLARLTRDQHGIQLVVQSEVFEEHFRALSGNSSKNILPECGHKFYIPQNPPVQSMPGQQGKPGYSVTSEAGHGLYHGERVNLAFLRAVGIKDGVTIKINNAVYSAEKLRQWLEHFRDGAKLYYLQVIKPVTMEVEITSREI
jgi:hypothetical protein